MLEGQFHRLDLAGFLAPDRNGREARQDLILHVAKQLKEKHTKSLGAVGFCYGAWGCFHLGSSKQQLGPVVDYIAVGHPSMITKEDIDDLAVPLLVLAPEIDFAYTKDLKVHTFETMIERQLPFEYRHFPGVEHACLVRGDARKEGERQALEAGKNAVVHWIGSVQKR
jgi:dienelactone hydrolase